MLFVFERRHEQVVELPGDARHEVREAGRQLVEVRGTDRVDDVRLDVVVGSPKVVRHLSAPRRRAPRSAEGR